MIRLYEVYETETDVILVQELCKGGELMQRVEKLENLNEHKIANIFKQILLSIEYCHQNTIVHRDLKPENFMFASEKDDAKIKLIDFGLATRLTKHKKGHKSVLNGIKSRVGTIIFMAPEVIKQDYSYKCDLWSAGVILYILIWGQAPFYENDEYETISKILDYDFEFTQDIWNVVTPELKDMINHLLVPEDERFSAEEALNHEWIIKHEMDNLNLSLELPNYLKRFKKFQNFKRLKKIILTYFSTRLQDSKIIRETEMFQYLDKNKDGVIDIEELRSSIKGAKDVHDDWDSGENSMNFNSTVFSDLIQTIWQNGAITYTEWIAGAKDWNNSTMIEDAYKTFDIDSEEHIDIQKLKEMLKNDQDLEESVKKIWKDLFDKFDIS